MKVLNEFLNKAFIYYTRYDFLKSASNKLGKCVIEEDKIVCKINTKKLRKRYKKSPYYHFCLNGILVNKNTEELCRLCNIDKPIYYIIENMNFDKALQFSSRGNCDVLFKNCTFNKQISIYYGTNITFSKNKYCDIQEYYFCGHTFFNVSSKVKSLKFINDNLCNSVKKDEQNKLHPPKFGLNIKTNKLEIINSNIKSDKPGDISIYSNNLIIDNSTISANQMFIDASNINCTNSCIESSEGIIVDSKSHDFLASVLSKTIIYNGIESPTKEDKTDIYSNKKVRKDRLRLIYTLKSIKKFYNKYNNFLVTDYKVGRESRKIKELVK